MGNPWTVRQMMQLYESYTPDMFFVSETKVTKNIMEQKKRRVWGFQMLMVCRVWAEQEVFVFFGRTGLSQHQKALLKNSYFENYEIS